MYAYFITLEQEELFYACANKGVYLLDYNLCAKNETYVVYNREYPWSNSCQRVKTYAYRNTFLKTGDKELVTEEKDVIKSFDFEKGVEFGKEIETYEKDIEISIGEILTASTELSWSEEFDLSIPEVSSRDVPCAELIECLNLRQLNYDGVYYDVDGELAAFDTRVTQNIEGVVVRKDLIDKFLEIKNLRLLWIINAAKEEHTPNLYISNYSEWSGVISYDGNSLRVNINKNNRKYN